MSRDEVVQHLLDQGCLITKKRSNGMWIVYNEVTDVMVAIPVTDPARAGNVCRICEDLGILLPNDPDVQAVKRQLNESRRKMNLGSN